MLTCVDFVLCTLHQGPVQCFSHVGDWDDWGTAADQCQNNGGLPVL